DKPGYARTSATSAAGAWQKPEMISTTTNFSPCCGIIVLLGAAARSHQLTIRNCTMPETQLPPTATPAAADEPKFVQGLGLWDSTMIVAGSMIGSGIFI